MKLWYKGEKCNVEIVKSTINTYKVFFNLEQFVINCPKSVFKTSMGEIAKAINRWYVRQARNELTSKSIFYADKIGVKFNRISIKDTKTRWGSCSSKGNLNFNYQLIKMPEDILDYVVIHEVCHLKMLNHSKEYWKLVGEYCPDYKERIKWVKLNAGGFIG